MVNFLTKKGYLLLENGKIFQGQAFGLQGKALGELVFNTSMTGYQEIITNPTHAGQIINFTCPLIGNYGTNNADWESKNAYTRGIVVKNLSLRPNNHRMLYSLDEFLKENKICGLTGADSRAISRLLREEGSMQSILITDGTDQEEAMKLLKEREPEDTQSLLAQVSTKNTYVIPGGEKRVVLLDFGVKNSCLSKLQESGFSIFVMPASSTAAEILSYKPEALLISSGPGNPAQLTQAQVVIKELALKGLPIYGVSLGHQLIGLAFGGKIEKLKFGHRGANQPVKNLETGKVYISNQDHGYALDRENLPEELIVTHINLHDGSIEGIRHRDLPIAGMQYYCQEFVAMVSQVEK